MTEIQLALIVGFAIGCVVMIVMRPVADYIYWRINQHAHVARLDAIDHARQSAEDAMKMIDGKREPDAIFNLCAVAIRLCDVLERVESRR